jgi:DNA-binding MarR family transcriptional regulator
MPDNAFYPLVSEINVYASLLFKYFNEGLEERLRQQGIRLTALQYGVLRMLQFEVLTISTISHRMGLDPSSMVRIIDALERKGLVMRETDPRDRRRNPIRISDLGIELLSVVPAVSERDPAFQALGGLGEDQVAHLRDLLRAIIVMFPEGRLVAGLFSGESGGPIPHDGPATPVNK